MEQQLFATTMKSTMIPLWKDYSGLSSRQWQSLTTRPPLHALVGYFLPAGAIAIGTFTTVAETAAGLTTFRLSSDYQSQMGQARSG